MKNTMFCALAAAALCVVMAIGFGYCHLFLRNTLLYKAANLMNDLPVAIPHTVAGLALLLAFGRTNFGFIGSTGLAFTLVAVILAMFFVSYPLAARAVATGVDQMDQESIIVARTLGDTPTMAFIRIALPGLREALFSGFVLAFARSLSEFAAVIMFGGNVPGSTQVLASYVFTKVEEGEVAMAVTASGFCIMLSLILVFFAGFSPEDRHVGYVPQQSSLFRHMNVRDNIRYCLRNKRGAEANIGKLIEMLGLEDVLDKKPDALSGGFQSRVALARTLASQPHVMLMDEPLSDLDLAIKEKLLPEFKRVLKTLGVPVIYVTHDLTEANLLGDRFSCMIEGVLTDADSAETAFGLIKESVLSKDLRK